MQALRQSPIQLPAESVSICAHCGNEIPSARQASLFCCAGCETVFHLLEQRGLQRYYEIRSKGRSLRRPEPASLDGESYLYLDDPEFLDLYADQDTAGNRRMRFYLEGVHCAACVWLTERVGEFVPGVQGARLNLGNSVVQVTLRHEGSFSKVAREFSRLGYRPHPVRLDEGDALVRSEDRWLLARAGVAGACAGNIMLLAVSLYAGAEGDLARTFRWASFGLSLPVLLFSATPFYRGAWRALRTHQVSIDLPIALGILIGAVSSAYNLVSGSPYLYFDSLSTLVFLMLSSRYLLIKAQRAAADSSQVIRFLMPSSARVLGEQPGTFRDVPVDRIKPGDTVAVFSNECIPVDGVVLDGHSSVDNSLLSGESLPVAVQEGQPVFAGTVNQTAPIRVRATASGSATRLAKTLRTAQDDLSKKAHVVTFADRVARVFVAAVLVSVLIVFAVGLRHGLHHAVDLALALSIVTCPCAFALATPLALSVAMGRCAREGVLIKSADTIERLSQVESVVFDKTGTLTEGKFGVESWDPELKLESDGELLGAVLALESLSAHPVARAICDRFHRDGGIPRQLPSATEFREAPGQGVSGVVGGHLYELRGEDRVTSLHGGVVTTVGVWRDRALLGRIYLGDRLRADSVGTLHQLRLAGQRLRLLSGDTSASVQGVAACLGLQPWSWRAGLSPEQKRSEVGKIGRALMVGDGANDAPALAAAYVSVAVHGGVEVSLRSSDVYCRKPGVRSIPPLLVVASETMKVIRRNFKVSLVYNAIGILGVVLGWVTPLFAAVLMPISALTVFASSFAGTARLRRAIAEMGR